MLTRLYVHNFRSFVNFEWSLPAACVLVGDNGAGKSALIEVLWLLQDLVVVGKAIDETVSRSARTVWLKDEEQTIEIDMEFRGDAFRYRLGIRVSGGTSALSEDLRGGPSLTLLYHAAAGKVDLYGDSPPQESAPRASIPFDRRRSFLSALEPRADNTRITAFREALASIWAMKPDPRRLGGAAVAESPLLDRDLSNFASWYRDKAPEDPEATDELRDDLRRVMRGFQTLRLEPISSEVKDLRARFSFGRKTHELAWAKLSDGQRLLIALYGLLRFGLTKASLIALDESENYVAPGEIQPWLRAVAALAAEHGKQLLVVSHHPESINYLAADAAFRMWLDVDAGHTRIAPLVPDLSSGMTAYEAVRLADGPPDGPAADHE